MDFIEQRKDFELELKKLDDSIAELFLSLMQIGNRGMQDLKDAYALAKESNAVTFVGDECESVAR